MSIAEARTRIADALQHRRYILLCLDFDGTLAPIQDDPASVTLPEQNRSILDVIRRDPRVDVAIISGRSLQDLKNRIPLSLTFAGNHGLEIRGRGFQYVDQKAGSSAARLRNVTSELNTKLNQIDGALVENKGLTASVHYRNVPLPELPAVSDAVQTAILPVANVFEVREGNRVFEIMPHVGRSKGVAARYILDNLDRGEVLTVCIGDDATDEDMFTSMSGGVTIRVGPPAPTAAKYRLDGVEDVTAFLDEIATMLREHRVRVRRASIGR